MLTVPFALTSSEIGEVSLYANVKSLLKKRKDRI